MEKKSNPFLKESIIGLYYFLLYNVAHNQEEKQSTQLDPQMMEVLE